MPEIIGLRRKEFGEPRWQRHHLKQDKAEEENEKEHCGLKERRINDLLNQTRIRGVLPPWRRFGEEGAIQDGTSKYP